MYTVQYDSSDLYAFLVLNVCTVTKFRSKVSEATYEVAIPRYMYHVQDIYFSDALSNPCTLIKSRTIWCLRL